MYYYLSNTESYNESFTGSYVEDHYKTTNYAARLNDDNSETKN